MTKDKLIKRQVKLIDLKNEQIIEKDKKIDELNKKLESLNNSKLSKEIKATESEVKKNKKFDVKMWLLTSSFAICSCIFGLTNLILNLVKSK